MSTPDIIANVARGWNRHPEAVAYGSSKSSLSAALWSVEEGATHEVQAEPDDDNHIVTVALSVHDTELLLDHRKIARGHWRHGGLQIVRAGERPRAVVRGFLKVLHIYVPRHGIDRVLADEDWRSSASSAFELIDPEYAFDRVAHMIAGSIVAEMRDGAPLSRLRIDTLGQELAIHLVREHSTYAGWCRPKRYVIGLPNGGFALERVRRAQDYLEVRLGDDISLAEFAAAVELSPRQLTEVFTRATGLPPHRWLMRRRVERACELLLDPKRSISDIAYACGFSSSQHLATKFRAQVGCTPSNFRRDRLG